MFADAPFSDAFQMAGPSLNSEHLSCHGPSLTVVRKASPISSESCLGDEDQNRCP